MKMKFLKTLLMSLFVLLGWSHSAYSQSQWEQTSTPPGGSVWALGTIGTNLFAGTASGGVYFSNDDGTSWVQRNGAFPSMQVNSLIVNGHDVFVGTINGQIYKSSDSGLNWIDVTPSGFSFSNTVQLVLDGTNIYAGTDGDGVFMSPLSNISTTSWSSFNTGLTNQTIRALKIKGTTIYAGTYGDGVWSSSTNTPNWSLTSAILPALSDYIVALDVSGSTIFAGNVSGLPVLYRSTNNGLNWVQSDTNIFEDKPVYVIYNDGDNVYAGTEGVGILQSNDNGVTWSEFNLGFRDGSGDWFCNQINVRSLAITPNNMFAGTDCGVWKRSLTTLGTNEFSDSNQFLLYPNPNNGKFKVNSNTTNLINVEVFNLLGKKILTKVNVKQASDEIDISNIPKGVYIVQIQDGNIIHTEKIVIQ